MSTAAAVLALAFGVHAAADMLLGALIIASGAESILAFCVGCEIFNLGMRAGLVPGTVCAECADISRAPRPSVDREATGAGPIPVRPHAAGMPPSRWGRLAPGAGGRRRYSLPLLSAVLRQRPPAVLEFGELAVGAVGHPVGAPRCDGGGVVAALLEGAPCGALTGLPRPWAL